MGFLGKKEGRPGQLAARRNPGGNWGENPIVRGSVTQGQESKEAKANRKLELQDDSKETLGKRSTKASMMATLTTASKRLKITGAALAMAALLIALLAVVYDRRSHHGPSRDSNRTTSPGPEKTQRNMTTPSPARRKQNRAPIRIEVIRRGLLRRLRRLLGLRSRAPVQQLLPPRSYTRRRPTMDSVERLLRLPATTPLHTHISETVFSIDDSYKVTVIDNRDRNYQRQP